MIGLFIDDERNPEDVKWLQLPSGITWTIIRNKEELEEYIEMVEGGNRPEPDVYSFDHDLQCFEEDGREFDGCSAFDLLERHEMLSGGKLIIIHTQNPVGRQRLKSRLDDLNNRRHVSHE